MYRKQSRRKSASQRLVQRGIQVFLVAAVAVLACSITVFAWFQANITNTVNSITSATYKLDVSITANGGTAVPSNGDNSYPLQADTSYSVTLTAGQDGASTGYCEISGADKKWYTKQIVKGDTLTFTFVPGENDTYTFTAMWGEYEGEANVGNGKELKLGNVSSEEVLPPAAPDKVQEKPSTVPEAPSNAESSEESSIVESESSQEESIESNASTVSSSASEEEVPSEESSLESVESQAE